MRLLTSELRLHLVSLLVWLVSVAALVALIVAFYPAVRDNQSLNSLYGDMSPALQSLLGGSDLTSPVGYLNTQLFAFVLPAVLLVFGVGRGAATLAGEEEARTLDLLLAQPVRRRSAYLQKGGAVALSVAALGAVAWVGLAVLDHPVRLDLPLANVAAACLQMSLFALALSLVAQAVAAASGRRTTGVAVAAGYAVVSYVVYGLSDTVSWLSALRPLTLWRWSVGNDPLTSGFGGGPIVVLVAVCLVAAAVGAALFDRRDLHG